MDCADCLQYTIPMSQRVGTAAWIIVLLVLFVHAAKSRATDASRFFELVSPCLDDEFEE